MAIAEVEARSGSFHLQHPGDTTKVLWVSSTGGHLSELRKIGQSVGAAEDSLWVTFDTPQSRGCLDQNRTFFVDYVAPRDVKGAARAAHQVSALLRREQFDMCVSTGAAVATGILPMAAARGISTYYIESLARTTAPSVTGKLLALAPRVRTLTQYEQWASRKWPFAGSLLDGWRADDVAVPSGPLKVMVTLGTIRPYRFDRAVDAVLRVLRPGDEVRWQLGATTRPDLPGDVRGEICQEELTDLALEADVVVAHAGVGSMLHLFENGISPVVAVRSGRFGEHVDDHQQQLAASTAARGLTSTLDLGLPSRQVLLEAAGRVISSKPLASVTARTQ